MADKPDEIISLTGDKNQTSIQDDLLVGIIKGRLGSAEDARFFDEERWLRAYRNYRGVYGNDMSFTDTEKSRVFVKVTKTKVLAAYGQITDVLFSSGKFPIGVDPTQIPDGISQYAHIDKTKEQESLGPTKKKEKPVKKNYLKVQLMMIY